MANSVSRRMPASGKSSFKKVGILAKAESKISINCLRKILPIFKKFKELNPEAIVCVDKAIVTAVPKASFLKAASEGSIAATCDLVLSVGGDGTLLRVARLLLESDGWKKAALLGVNTGRLGFLTILGSDEVSAGLQKILFKPGTSANEKRQCLDVRVIRKRKVFKTFHVLNDCVLKNGALSRLIEFGITMNSEFLSSYRADGLIVSTPTGSTAYNLAAGGSILEPQIPAIQLTPICAQSFSNKPIVVSNENLITLTLKNCSSDVYLTLDGQTSVKIESEDRIQIRNSLKSINLLLPEGTGPKHYLSSLRQKLKWGLVSPAST